MRIINQAKKTTVAQEAVVADTPLARVKGLLGKKELALHHALILKPCNSIHTFFMQFPIDVLFMDRNNAVVAALSDVQPFRLSRLYYNAHCVIELPAGTIAATSTTAGDTLAFE